MVNADALCAWGAAAPDKLVKLNTNESPYPPSPQVLQPFVRSLAIVAAVSRSRVRGPEAGYCRRNGLQAEQVFVGNGSDEVLALTFHGTAETQLPLIFPDITYSFYPVWCELYEYRLRDDSGG